MSGMMGKTLTLAGYSTLPEFFPLLLRRQRHLRRRIQHFRHPVAALRKGDQFIRTDSAGPSGCTQLVPCQDAPHGGHNFLERSARPTRRWIRGLPRVAAP